jgi:hypothetical protein
LFLLWVWKTLDLPEIIFRIKLAFIDNDHINFIKYFPKVLIYQTKNNSAIHHRKQRDSVSDPRMCFVCSRGQVYRVGRIKRTEKARNQRKGVILKMLSSLLLSLIFPLTGIFWCQSGPNSITYDVQLTYIFHIQWAK